MAKLGDTIVSSALSGVPLTLSDKAFEQVGKQATEVQELKGQVAALLALVAAQQTPVAPVVPVEEAPVEEAPKVTKAKA